MVAQKYRWDFIGLSTDQKPTASTSPKVTDGSTYYCSDNSKLYVWYKDQWYERKALGGGGGGGGSYTAGTGITIDDDTISVDTTTIQAKLTAGSNVTISDDTISATDTTYSAFTGTDGTAAGAAGLVPAPATTDAGKFLKADGTWDTAGGGGGVTPVQSTGASTTDVMSQNAVTGMVFADPGTQAKIRIGSTNTVGADSLAIGVGSASTFQYTVSVGGSAQSKAAGSTSIGFGSESTGAYGVSIGYGARAGAPFSFALPFSVAAAQGVAQFGLTPVHATEGYNNSQYRLIRGIYDGQDANDAVTVGQVNSVIDAINTALSTNIPHIGA